MRLTALALFTLAPIAFATGARASEWTLDPEHSEIGFSVRHMMVTDVRGAFEKYTGTITVDDKDPTKSKVVVEIDVASINTKVVKRDTHLRSPEFFDAAKFPKISFTSTKIEKGAAANTYKVNGDLTMHGVTKPVVLDVSVSEEWQDPKEWGGRTHRGVKASAKVNRQDFGVSWQTKLDKGGVVVGDEVTIVINAELIKK